MPVIDLDDDGAFTPLGDTPRVYTIPRFTCRLIADGTCELPTKSLEGPEGAAEVIAHLTRDLPFEQFWAVYLNVRNTVVGCELVSQGGQHGCAILPRDVFRGALLAGAHAIVVGHCHPSGDPRPSQEDLSFTERLNEASRSIGITILDHVIVARGAHAFSMREHGLGGF